MTKRQVVRDTVTGAFVEKGEARRRPATTVTETLRPKTKGKAKPKTKKKTR